MATLLVVDDQEANRYLLEVLLKGHGHAVETACNGVEALDKARRQPPEVIITDILMPEMDGFALCRAWKKDPQLKGIPLIFYTATYTDPKDEKFALSLGAERFIIKPTEPERFLAILDQLLAEHRAGQLSNVEPPLTEEHVFLKEYNQALIHKLEDKIMQLERANKQLVWEIEDHKRTEEALLRSEEKYRTLMEAVADPVIVYDQYDRVLYANQAFSLVFGWDRLELTGKPLDFVPPEFAEEMKRKLDEVLVGEPCRGYETKRLTKSNQILDVSISAACFRDSSGSVQGIVVSIRDISQRKQAEQEKDKLKAQLVQAQKMEAIGTLAGGIAHDFNNLLGVMAGFAELALDHLAGNARGSEYLGRVIEAGQRAQTLVKQILAFSRRTPGEMRPMDLNKEVRQAATLLEHTLPKMISVETYLADDLQTVNGDCNELEQVLLNLATNAQDAMPQGGRLVFETSNVSIAEDRGLAYLKIPPGEYVSLQVSDTGHGIDEQTREQIFDPFFTTKGPGKGTGLGLSTVYAIVKSHEGHVFCYSEPGRGTTFKIFLPAFQGAGGAQSQDRLEREPPAGGHETILLVDDEPSLLQLGKTILSQAGYNILTARSGEEAIEVYRAGTPSVDLVITDLSMPGIGGHKTLQAILDIAPQAKVLVASGYSANSQVRDLLQSGAIGYVAKPFSRVELLTKIRQALGLTSDYNSIEERSG